MSVGALDSSRSSRAPDERVGRAAPTATDLGAGPWP